MHSGQIQPEITYMGRRNISQTIRWQVFARDGFRCRYCGAPAGDPGVVLHVDHVVSVADGGTNSMDNLVAACQRCNGGKSARSLDQIPGSPDAVEHATKSAATMLEQADAISLSLGATARLRDATVDMIHEVYDGWDVIVRKSDISRYVSLVRQYGIEAVHEWLVTAEARRVTPWNSLRYVYGIIRNQRAEGRIA